MNQEWQPIETAPKGTYAESTNDPKWVAPPDILGVVGGKVVIMRWDWYYAEGGDGFDGRSAWIVGDEGFQAYEEPTHWMPLPEPPK